MNAIILTGGIAHSKYVTDMIRDYVSSIARYTSIPVSMKWNRSVNSPTKP